MNDTAENRPARESPEDKGYTLIEIMLAVGLVTILVLMAIPNLQIARRTALETSAIQGLKELSEAEELYYEVYGYYTAGHDQWHDLRRVDAIDHKAWSRTAGRRGVFIKGYSIQLINLGQYPQNYSIVAWPIEKGMELKTFFIVSDGLVRDWNDVHDRPITLY